MPALSTIKRIKVKSLAVPKSVMEMNEDVFYGSDYSRYRQKSAHGIVTTHPQIRCHTQPTGNVFLSLGCGGKKMVAHEDSRRPQCGLFFNRYNFTLRRGHFDMEMTEYWIKNVNPMSMSFTTSLM
jgi:hypothetical protein